MIKIKKQKSLWKIKLEQKRSNCHLHSNSYVASIFFSFRSFFFNFNDHRQLGLDRRGSRFLSCCCLSASSTVCGCLSSTLNWRSSIKTNRKRYSSCLVVVEIGEITVLELCFCTISFCVRETSENLPNRIIANSRYSFEIEEFLSRQLQKARLWKKEKQINVTTWKCWNNRSETMILVASWIFS